MIQIAFNHHYVNSVAKQPAIKTSKITFQQPVDTFTRQVDSKNTISFEGKSKVSLRKIFKEHPELKEVIKKLPLEMLQHMVC